MTPLATICGNIITAIFGVVEQIKFVDIDLGQLKTNGQNIPIEYPAVIIRFENIFWLDFDASKQIGTVHVRLKIIYPYTEEYYPSVHGVRDEVETFFEIVNEVHQAVWGISPFNHTKLFRFSEGHLESLPEEMKWVYFLDYKCNVYSDGSSIDQTPVNLDYAWVERENMFLEMTIDGKKIK